LVPRPSYSQTRYPHADTLIDWTDLRQQLKADVKLALIDKAQTDIGKGGFAGIFGGALTALLVPTLVDSAVDAMVTPEKLVHNDKVDDLRRQGKSLARFVTYAFFTSPTAFRVDLKDPDDKDSPTITTLLPWPLENRGAESATAR